MKFTETPIPGAYLIEIEPLADERGFFARTMCRDEFACRGLNTNFVQQSVSHNKQRGIIRGLHYQVAPHAEEKLVRATAGAVFDVIVDVRSVSPTRGQWFGVELTAGNHRALYLPKGIAHGFQVLEDGTEMFYQMTVAHNPAAATGIAWNDPSLSIAWPLPDEAMLSTKDLAWPTLDNR